MKTSTRVFLVLLRLAIGWHFLFEGIDKIRSVDLVGETTTNRPWTSRAYLRGASGPAGEYFRRLSGDPDEETLTLLTPQPVPAGKDPATVPPHERVPPLLDEKWNEYLERFATKYDLTPHQRAEAQVRLDQAKDFAVRWMLGQAGDRGVRAVEKSFGPAATVQIKENSLERITAYRNKVRQLQEILNEKLPAFGHDVEGKDLLMLRAEIDRMRADLLADLEKPMIETLNTVLTADQRKLGPLPTEQTYPANLDLRNFRSWDGLGENWNRVRHWDRQAWLDALTRYGLALVGLCLLVGLFTRTACLGGAVFLALFYLAMPALPWLPENPRAEGHYFYINKNIIEMLALLALATTASGRWLGLDGLLYVLNPWHWRARPALPPATRAPRAR